MIKHEVVDKVCVWSSLLCSIHCLLTPVILIALPYIGMIFWANETAERLFIGTSATLAFGSVCYGYTKHRRCWIFIPVSLGIVVLLVGIAHHDHDNTTAMRNFFGGLCICVSHLINMRLCRSCSECKHAR